MAERVISTVAPERRVFGDAFSLASGRASDETVNHFFGERAGQVHGSGEGWLPRTLSGEQGVVADFFRDGMVVATIEHDFDTGISHVYRAIGGGEYEDATQLSTESFDDAVIVAEAEEL